jgi:hypothetical protein
LVTIQVRFKRRCRVNFGAATLADGRGKDRIVIKNIETLVGRWSLHIFPLWRFFVTRWSRSAIGIPTTEGFRELGKVPKF